MIKKLFIIGLLVMFALVSTYAFAKSADVARVAGFDSDITGGVVCIGDASSGLLVDVDSSGSLQVLNRENYSASRQVGDKLILTGAGVIQRVIFTPNTADDYLLVYDGTSASGTLLVDLQGHTADQTLVFELGVNVATGIYVDESNSSDCDYTVVYDSD